MGISKQTSTHIWIPLTPLVPTKVMDTYWRFAVERQEIFYKRIAGLGPPWTSDEILKTFRFTNVYRASDRVSQYLIQNVIYRHPNISFRDMFFRVLLFKFFNKPETWEMLEEQLGLESYQDFDKKKCERLLNRAMSNGETIFSSAYIMPSGGKRFPGKKHAALLEILSRMMSEEVPDQILDSSSMKRAFEILRNVPLLGDFLAYQYLIDLNYTPHLNFNEMEFVVPGPGAIDGIAKCFQGRGGLNEGEIIRFVAEKQADEFSRLGLDFQSLWGRPLMLIDCQNLFCEVDKYSRVAHPEFSGKTGRKRIKRKFSPSSKPLNVWYPPKWGINQKIPKE